MSVYAYSMPKKKDDSSDLPIMKVMIWSRKKGKAITVSRMNQGKKIKRK
jgi:hypothetical protein